MRTSRALQNHFVLARHTHNIVICRHISVNSQNIRWCFCLSRKWWFCLSLKRYLACLSFYGVFKRDLQLLEKTAFFSFRAAAVVSWLLWLLESPLKLKISSVQQKPLKTRLHCFFGERDAALLSYGFFFHREQSSWCRVAPTICTILVIFLDRKTQLKRKLHFNSIFLLLSFSEFETNLAV